MKKPTLNSLATYLGLWPFLCYVTSCARSLYLFGIVHLIVVAASSSGGIGGIVTGWSSIMNFINSVSISTTEEEEVHWETVFFATKECLSVLRSLVLSGEKNPPHIIILRPFKLIVESSVCLARNKFSRFEGKLLQLFSSSSNREEKSCQWHHHNNLHLIMLGL